MADAPVDADRTDETDPVQVLSAWCRADPDTWAACERTALALTDWLKTQPVSWPVTARQVAWAYAEQFVDCLRQRSSRRVQELGRQLATADMRPCAVCHRPFFPVPRDSQSDEYAYVCQTCRRPLQRARYEFNRRDTGRGARQKRVERRVRDMPPVDPAVVNVSLDRILESLPGDAASRPKHGEDHVGNAAQDAVKRTWWARGLQQTGAAELERTFRKAVKARQAELKSVP